jgi:2-polyprenyl-3-methyl-5-hydroxy-6-metoxy-1,4-benzoquinol methylase
MDEMRSGKATAEILHGRYLAERDPELIWGWKTPAGKIRADRRANLIIAATGLRPGKKALEIGCGTGLFTEKFARSGARIIAVDISESLVSLAARRHLPEHQVKFMVRRFEDCDVEGPFDAVIGSSILHHLDISQAVPKIFSLLKPGGIMSFAEPNMLNPQIFVQKNIPAIKRYLGDTPDETAFFSWRIRKFLNVRGFVAISVTPFDWLHPYTPHPLIRPIVALGRMLEKTPLIRQFAGSLHITGSHPPS